MGNLITICFNKNEIEAYATKITNETVSTETLLTEGLTADEEELVSISPVSSKSGRALTVASNISNYDSTVYKSDYLLAITSKDIMDAMALNRVEGVEN